MLDVKGEPKTLAQEKLASQNALRCRLGEVGSKLLGMGIDSVDFVSKKQACLEHFGGRIRHDAVGNVEAPEKYGRGCPYGNRIPQKLACPEQFGSVVV
jgi:hypothetical protein